MACTLHPDHDVPTHRSVTARVAGGLDGVVRVLVLLRGRRYRVRHLAVDVERGSVECTATLTAADTRQLLERLRRLPAVISAEQA